MIPPWLLTLPVALPLACALLALTLPAPWTGRWVRMGSLLCALTIFPCIRALLQHGPIRQNPGGWGAPLGIQLYLDGPSALFLIFAALLGVGVGWYAVAYFTPGKAGTRARQFLFWPLWFVTWAAVNSLFLTLDLFNIYVSMELVSIAGVGLILIAGSSGATRAALQYQMQTLVAGLIYLLGVGLVYNATGNLDLHLLRDYLEPGPLKNAGLALMTAGLLIKAALFPMHFWLPKAHADAPAPVSAILSGLVVTTAFVMLSKIWFSGLGVLAPVSLHLALGALGSAGILWGGILALQQRRLKRILAYSTVSQVGYLFLVFALTFQDTPDPARLWSGAVYLAISHGLAKGAAFMAAGVLQKHEGTDQLSLLRGAALRNPGAVAVLAVASINLMGLPPSLGFVGKWWMIKSAIYTGQGGLAVILLLGGLLSGAYLFRVFEALLRPKETESSVTEERPAPPSRLGMLLPAMLLALATLLPVLFLSVPNRILSIGSPVPQASTP